MGSVFLRFGAEFVPDHIDRLRKKVNDYLELGGIVGPTAYVLMTVVDELVCNILEHGEASWVELELYPESKRVRLIFRDDGKQFDPSVSIGAKEPGVVAESESERNLGLYMVAQLVSSYTYHRLDGKVNELTLVVETEEKS
jgi:anti-sigma regulatory factor (Ser/Thr protein kinase)